MLISRVSEREEGGHGEGRDAGEYQTADELFELMAKDHSYDNSENQPLSTRDLIILYKNIEVGSKLISNSNVEQCKAPNQHVETVVYKDERESDDSDVSEIYSNEDLQDLFSINNERIDLINNLSSAQHPLCHKLGDIEIQSSNLTSEYDSHFLFKDPYIKQQLKNINILPDTTEFDTILPASLLDYICCKRLEDNYNFYMDNIIKYVQHTIEQLKRISNGDYLTDRAKEKWREVVKDLVIPNSNATKVLATSVSIPIHVMGKVDGHKTTWDDIVHSEVDVRSLSKILEKKIIIEVPKLICGSYRLFSERYADNLIISCKKDLNHDVDQDKRDSRVNVVFQLKPSGSGHVISNSIMILQKMPSITTPDPNGNEHDKTARGNINESLEEHPKIVEIIGEDHKDELESVGINSDIESSTLEITIKKASVCSLSNNYLSSSHSNTVNKGQLKRKVSIKTLKTETDFTVMSPDELRCAIRRLNMQTPVPEESEESCISKKKSPTRVRIKSPYENQSYSIEEKKRKKLLEIREKREKKKMALSENCKVSKHKYGKTTVMAQPSSSVTKLSISNKSFYNSIYGDSVNYEGGISKKSRKSLKRDISEQDLRKDVSEDGLHQPSPTILDRSPFDDGATETIVQMQQQLDTDTIPTPNSDVTNYSTSLLSQIIDTYGTDGSSDDDSSLVGETKRDGGNVQEIHERNDVMGELVTCPSACILAPANSPKEKYPNPKNEIKKTTMSVECRKSIDQIYDLLKTLGKHDENEITNSGTQYVSNVTDDLTVDTHRSSTIQVSDSGTSVKHHIVSSNPSTFSFEKNNNLYKQRYKDKKKKEAPATVVPKVIISTKLQTSKIDGEWNKTDRKRITSSASPKVPDNPLKAISQLLHEFNNVQKTRHKTNKKEDPRLADGKIASRQGSSKKPRQEQTSSKDLLTPLRSLSYKERRSRPGQPSDPSQFYHQLTHGDDKHAGKSARRNLSDIIDEAKEARGEAVKGPSKQYTRLNTLAQPKKSYVQALNDEYQTKYARNIAANRLQRGTTSTPLVEKNTVNANSAKNKRKGPEVTTVSQLKPGISAIPPLERIIRPRRSASNSPARMRVPQSTIETSLRQITAPISPDLKKKMVAVESYVKNHYGHVPIDTSELKGQEVHKSRVPLIPNDIDLASISSPVVEGSTALGNQLHYMVDTMINTNAPVLSVLTERQESMSKLSDGLEKLSTDSSLKIEEHKSESDYPVDIFEDKSILTAVACIPKDKIQDKVVDENIDTVVTYDVQPFNSATELRKLENALYQQMSVGAFPKRLRIKNLTLTPKQSLQQVIVVQSGDAGSLLVKSSLSQNFKSDSKTDSLTALKPLAALSNTHINWGLSNIPLQVATIGYAFPTFQSFQGNSLTPYVQTLMENLSNEDVSTDACKSHKTSQCFKGVHTESSVEQATQANIVVSITSTCNVNTNTSAKQKEKIKKESNKTQNCEKMQPITKICERIRPMIEKFETPITEKCDKEQPRTKESQILQPVSEKCSNVQIVAEKCKKPQGLTEKCEKVQPITEQCKREQWESTQAITASKMSLTIGKDIKEGEDVKKKPSEIIDHSTSLDILMGLLNEIRKITGDTINKNIDNEHEQNNQSKELEIILNNAVTHESSIENNCRDIASVSSFDKFHKLDSIPSLCSFNLLKEGDRVVINNENKGVIQIVKDSTFDSYEPKHVDKEVSVDIEKQHVNKLTDAPSCFFPLAINHSTNINDSVIEVLSQRSTPSVYSFANYETLITHSFLDDILEQSNARNTKVLTSTNNAKKADYFNILDDKEDKKICREQSTNVKVETMAVVSSSYKRASKIITNSTCVTIGSTFDPLIKIKRDVLVTVYSILVFTVFAALSFPKVFFHMEM